MQLQLAEVSEKLLLLFRQVSQVPDLSCCHHSLLLLPFLHGAVVWVALMHSEVHVKAGHSSCHHSPHLWYMDVR